MNHIVSPDNTDPSIERLIQAKGLEAPRVKPADIHANIVEAYYFTAGDGYAGAMDRGSNEGGWHAPHPALSLVTFCTLVLRNGFTVTGESACASPENFDAEIGKRVARANAEQKVWVLMGYALKESLYLTEQVLR